MSSCSRGVPRWRTEKQTYMAKLIVAFRNFSNVPKKGRIASGAEAVNFSNNRGKSLLSHSYKMLYKICKPSLSLGIDILSWIINLDFDAKDQLLFAYFVKYEGSQKKK
jgi:hypothetical protein